MKKTKEKFIHTLQPKAYLQQNLPGACGLFTIKTIIEAIYPNIKKPAKKYSSSWLHRYINFSLPKQLSSVLHKHKVEHKNGKYKGKNMKAKIDFLKENIKNGPIILLIAHAYTQKNMFDIIRAIFLQHYISIWGYNDQKEVFYCYDSNTKLQQDNLPIGNIELNYKNVITYRNFAGLGLFNKKYILINDPT